MITKMIFSIRPELKRAAMKKARSHGLSYAAVLNLATQSYVDGSLTVSALDTRLARSAEDVAAGRVHSLAAAKKKLRLK